MAILPARKDAAPGLASLPRVGSAHVPVASPSGEE